MALKKKIPRYTLLAKKKKCLKNSLYKEAALNAFLLPHLETANPVLLHRAVLQLLKSLSETEHPH